VLLLIQEMHGQQLLHCRQPKQSAAHVHTHARRTQRPGRARLHSRSTAAPRAPDVRSAPPSAAPATNRTRV
jgi:hypothetical protein